MKHGSLSDLPRAAHTHCEPSRGSVTAADGATSAAEMHKSYPAVKEAIAGVRHDVAAVASFLGASEEVVERIRLGVSEAATNVVQSVFEHSTGRIHVRLSQTGESELAVTVSDDGTAQRIIGPGQRLSFIVMRACADALALRQLPSGGVEAEMRFRLRRE